MIHSSLVRAAVILLVSAFVIAHSSPLQAEIFYTLENHPGGNQSSGGGYGLRVDNSGGVHTFNFEEGLSNVTFNFSTDGTNKAKIIGIVKHNQGSGHYWQISAELKQHAFTNDTTNAADFWNGSNTDLYDDMIADMEANADNENHAGEGNLKNANYAADRIGFEFVKMTMKHIGGQGAVDFTLGSQTSGLITLYDYPDNNPDVIPFFFAKGHRLNDSTDDIAAAGWLHEDEEDQNRLYTQDFLFKVGDQSDFSAIPEPTSFVLFGSVALFFARKRRR